jgi:HEAT repeat protein
LGKIGDHKSIEPLRDALQDSDNDVRKVVAEALNKIKWTPGKDAVSASYWISKGEFDKCIAIGALAVEPLITALKNSDYEVRRDAAEVLGDIGDPRAVEPLIIALKDSNRLWLFRIQTLLDSNILQ